MRIPAAEALIERRSSLLHEQRAIVVAFLACFVGNKFIDSLHDLVK